MEPGGTTKKHSRRVQIVHGYKIRNLLTLYPYTHTWDYRNELTGSSASSTTTFTYDTTGERLSVTDATSTVVYVNKLYSRENEDNTKYFYAGDTQVATIISTPNGEGEIEPEGPVYGGGAEPDGPECCVQAIFNYPHYIHTDHLTGSNITTKQDGSLEETLDYYPYGGIKLDQSTSSFKEKHKFTGHIYDDQTQLSYMDARYQNGHTGTFFNEDPVFWSTNSMSLTDPQSLNSYSYAVGNPLRYRDPDGMTAREAAKSSVKTTLRFIGNGVEGTVHSMFHPIETAKNLHKIPGAIKAEFQQISSDLASSDDAVRARGVTNGLLFVGSLLSPETRIGASEVDVAEIAAKYGWRSPGTLLGHFDDHAAELGITTVEGYAARGESFLGEALQNKWPMKINEANDRIFVTSPDYNTFGVYDLKGQTRSLFSPAPGHHPFGTNQEYWIDQPSNINLNF